MDLKEKQIIYVDNKPHIKCGVIILETKDTTPLFLNTHQTKVGDMVLQHGKFHHLYFTSNEKIKEGDWCYNSISNGLEKWSYKGWIEAPDFEYLGYKKIIATTDTSLGLPQPSQSFIEKYIEEYNKGNVITEVLVEVILNEWKSKDFRPVIFHDIDRLIEFGYNPKFNFTFKKGGLKLDSQNQITIRKQKDNWTREERVTDLLLALKESVMFPEKFVTGVGFDKSKAIKWIEENL